jgi:hypothetical protein
MDAPAPGEYCRAARAGASLWETLKYSEAFPAAQGRAAKIGGCKPLIL